ncbi:hypothetical protein [Marinobacter mobilis]|uniref:Uncharacterized protein n=1 Tax=Marinobacter mobilis TaxID=488533 RepID=A0A1H2Y952_9GAMM|nr:hypothetical protein [Marinobacter mobilis]SDX01752.1 hypothetical protein SAMN04487960_105304 [Marinobacter mobilis]SDX49256.1 hypothetical protein SAMN04487960_11034 [Marinobacter mobilis]
MYYKRLTDEAQLTAFKEGFEKASGNSVSMDYLYGAGVFGLYRKGTMIGGFVLNNGPQLRYAAMLGPHCAQLPFSLSDVVEITCYFLTERTPFHCSLAGLIIALECWRSGQSYILAGTRIEKVFQTHSRVIPNVFHQGLVDTPNGRQHWWFYWAERKQMPMTVLQEIGFRYLPRRKRALTA